LSSVEANALELYEIPEGFVIMDKMCFSIVALITIVSFCFSQEAVTIARLPAGTAPASVAIAEVNRDGKNDIIVASSGSNDVTVLLGDGTGRFTQSKGSPFPAGNSPNDIAVGDFNGDERVDLAFSNHETDYITVLIGDGKGRFLPAPGSPVPVQSQPHPHGIAAADFNGDAKLDLVVESTRDDKVEILFGNGGGGFETPGPLFVVGRRPYPKVRTSDLNRDGKADIITTDGRGNTVTVLIGDGKGGFSAANGSPFAVARSPFGVALGDINADTNPDLIVIHYSGNITNAQHDGLTILTGDGRGAFTVAAGSPFAVGRAPVSVAVGDINGDGILDAATANMGSNDVSVILGGRHTFTAAAGSPFQVGAHPSGVAVGDLNGDGKADIVVANSQDNDVTVLFSK